MLLLLAKGGLALAAGADDVSETAYRTSLAQEGLRKSAKDANLTLASLRAEMREYLPVQEAMLDAVFTRLELLSQDEMQKAVESLRSASKAGDLAGRIRTLSSAQKEQTNIEQRLRELSFQLNAARMIQELPAQLREIAKKQSVAQAEVERLSKRPAAADDPAQQAKQQAAASDQEKLSGDVQRISKTLASIADSLPADSKLRRAAESALQDGMDASSKQALEALLQGDLPAAASAQKKVLDSMERVLAVTESISRPTKERLIEAKSEIEQIHNRQKQLADRMPNMQPREMPRQEENAKAAAALDPLLSSLNLLAGDDISQARALMETAASILSSPEKNNSEVKSQAADKARAAVEKLAAAQRRIDAEIERAEKPPSAAEAAAELNRLSQSASNLAAEADIAADIKDPRARAEATAGILDSAKRLGDRVLTLDPVAAARLTQAVQLLESPRPNSQRDASAALREISEQLANKAEEVIVNSPESGRKRVIDLAAQAAAAASKGNEALRSSDQAMAQSNLALAAGRLDEAKKATAGAGILQSTMAGLHAAEKALNAAQYLSKEGAIPQSHIQTLEAEKQLAKAQVEMTEQLIYQATKQGLAEEQANVAQQVIQAAVDVAQARDTMNKTPDNASQSAGDLQNAARRLEDVQKAAAHAFAPDNVQKALEQAFEALASAKSAANRNQITDAKANTEAAAQDLQSALEGLPQTTENSPKPSSPEEESARAQNQIALASDAAAAAQQAIAKSPNANPGKLQEAEKHVQAAMSASANVLTPEAKQFLTQASSALQNARQYAEEGKIGAAQSATSQAQQPLAAAQSQMAQAASESPSSSQPQGQSQGQSQGQGDSSRPGQPLSQSNSQKNGKSENPNVKGGEYGVREVASWGAAGSDAQVVGGLSPRDREAAAQLQAVKPPPEFAPAVRQYYKNLAEDVTHD